MIRKLEQEEHKKTRKLWEEIFCEDSKKFLDYYYSVKTKENEIFIIEEDGDIRAMLQLNPYEMVMPGGVKKTNYIVGVATEKAYRGRKFMARLLHRALEEMYREHQPFTFLMPAAEAIYAPHGFRFIYHQKRCKIAGKKREFPEGILCRQAEEKDCCKIATFVEQYLQERCLVRTRRTVEYYQMMLKEQMSENGGILLLEREGQLLGCVYYAEEEEYMEIREPLLLPEVEKLLGTIVYALTGGEERMILCQAVEEQMLSEDRTVWEMMPQKPVIMARIVDLKAFLECFRAREAFSEEIAVKDEILSENCGKWKIEAEEGEVLRVTKEGELGNTDKKVITVEKLVEASCFWNRVFLNEIV